jgi:thiamine biosynthesis lipoprotein
MKSPGAGAAFFLLLILCLGACAPPPQRPEHQFALGIFCMVNLFDQGKPELYAKTFARLHELEDILSANRKDTDLDKVNRNAGIGPVKVRNELIEVLETAMEYAEKSRGFFDPSVGPLVKLWGIGTDWARVPAEEEIREALNLIDYHQIEINRKDGTVFLKRPNMALDLGAIAKGYAADELVRLLAREGVERAIIDLGGNILAMGEKKTTKKFVAHISDFFKNLSPGGNESAIIDGNFWSVGIQDPMGSRGELLGILKVKNMSLVTSGIYERFFVEGGKHYHHIFSTKNGYPVENDLLSVTIVTNRSTDADALSTSAFALGWKQGRDLIASVPGAEGIFVFNDMSVRLTGDLEKDFTLSSEEYYVAREE